VVNVMFVMLPSYNRPCYRTHPSVPLPVPPFVRRLFCLSVSLSEPFNPKTQRQSWYKSSAGEE